jgi:uncharacterized DUF497 family protein
MKFSWDPNKEKINRRDHKVSFFDACQVFADQCLLTMYDEDHSAEEERWISMGQISNGKIMVVVHTYKCMQKKEFVRIISARVANKKESREYLSRRF